MFHPFIVMVCSQSYTMEDWLHFVERYSPFVFKKGSVPDYVHDIWMSMMQLVVHYCRPPSTTHACKVSNKEQSVL